MIGVFDGHGGAACAQVVAKRLFNYISASLLPKDVLKKFSEGPEQPLLESFNDKYDFVQELKTVYSKSFKDYMLELVKESGHESYPLEKKLESTFLKLDEDLSKEALDLKTSCVDKKTLMVSLSGSVACVAHINGTHLHVASVGDCQAVLGTFNETHHWVAKKLSIEHNTDNPVKKSKIFIFFIDVWKRHFDIFNIIIILS